MEKEKSINEKIASGVLWRFLERGGVQLIQFVVQIIIARILLPEDYGVIAILDVFIAFSYTLINNGLGNALIQRQDTTEDDYSTVFYVQICIAAICTLILVLCAPLIQMFYSNITGLTTYLRVMSVILLIEALASIQLTILKKTMQFRKCFIANFVGVLVQGGTGIGMAFLGFGVWSLIVSQIFLKVAILITLVVMVHWKPKLTFSFARLKVLFSFSWKLTVAWMIGTLHQQLYSLVIGKYFSSEILGYYNRGQNLPNTMTKTINETVPSVMFPALSSMQDDKEKLKSYTRKMMSLTAFITAPIMAGIAGISKNFVLVFLTAKWAPCIPMMQLFCISMGINILSTTNMQAFNSLGRSDVFMKLEIIKRSISLVFLFVAAHFSVYLVIIVLAAMGVFSLVYNTFPNRKLLGYTVLEQLKDMLPSILISLVMFGCVLLINLLYLNNIVSLILQIVVGAAVYILLSFVFNKELVMDGRDLLKRLISK